MDIRMPERRRHRGHAPAASPTARRAPRVLMLTTFDQDEYVYDAMKAGASGFLLKDVRREELVDGRARHRRAATRCSPRRSRGG